MVHNKLLRDKSITTKSRVPCRAGAGGGGGGRCGAAELKKPLLEPPAAGAGLGRDSVNKVRKILRPYDKNTI